MEKRKISKRTIIIASILIILLGIPATYFLMIRNQEDSRAWFSSSWLYRKAITLTNSGSTITNAEVLVEIDTQTLISAGKLQADCDDLRFIDSDDSTALTYWVEGGCNQTNTQVWVEVPSLTNGSYVIYMYYGNTSATNSEASWSGEFFLFSNDTSCGTGWDLESNFYDKFPMGHSSYGLNRNAGHDHSFELTSSSATGSVGHGGQTYDPCTATELLQSTHTHDINIDTSNEDLLPPYYKVLVCSSPDLVMTNKISMFTNGTTPTNWTRLTAMDDRIPYGSSSAGTTGGSSTHTHTISSVSASQSSGTIISDTECDSDTTAEGSTTHEHSYSNYSVGSATSVPPYVQMLFATNDNSNEVGLSGMVVGSSAVPPLGWTQYSNLNTRFPRGSSSPGPTGGSAVHNHSISLDIGADTNTTGLKYGGGTTNVSTISHTHGTLSGNTPNKNNYPAYRSLIYIQRNSSDITSGNISEGSEESNSNQPPSAPTLMLTEGGTNPSHLTDTTPEFSAIYSDPESDNAAYYEIEVNTNNTFTGTVMWDSGQQAITITSGQRSSDITYSGSTISLDGSLYYWRIRFWDNQGNVSNWGITSHFLMNTAPLAPTNLHTGGQVNPVKVTDTTPSLNARCNEGDGEACYDYEIEVNTNNTFTGTVMWDTGQQSFPTPIADGAGHDSINYAGSTILLDATTYYWRMRMWDQYNTVGPWSETAQFTMSGPPNTPTALQTSGQTNPTYIPNLTPTFSALHTDVNTDNAIYYEIEVNTNSLFTGTVMWDSDKTSMTSTTNNTRTPEITYAGTPLSNSNTTYYWRIRVWDTDDNVSEWSTTAQFTDSVQHFFLEGIKLEGILIDPISGGDGGPASPI